MKEKFLRMIIKYIDLKGLLTEVVCDVMDEALQKVVEGTANPLDDAAKAALWPVAEKEAKKLIDEKLDLAKIFKLDQPADQG